MITYSFFRKDTGFFIGRTFCGQSDHLLENIPQGCDAIEGGFDHLSQRVDLATNKVVDYQPLQPSNDHEWIHDDAQGNRVRRWHLTIDAQTRDQADAQARAEIQRLEMRQARRIRELLSSSDPQLKALDDQIAALRSNLKR